MVSKAQTKRAEELAAKARGEIDPLRLVGREPHGDDDSLAAYGTPIIDYFETEEQPQYFFRNITKGVKIGDRHEKSGVNSYYQSAMCVTDRGVHFTVRHRGDNFHEFIPYSEIQGVSVRSGITKNKFVLETDRGEVIFATQPEPKAEFQQKADYITEEIERRQSQTTRSTAERADPANISLDDLQRIDERVFEELVAEVWAEQGWQTETTKGTADRGVDVVAWKDTPFEQKQLIQAKRYGAKNKVGSDAIQKYSGLYARNEQVDAVVVVTTSGFTREAQAVAKNRNVKLVDGGKLLELMQTYEIALPR